MADRVQYVMDKMATTLRQIDKLELLSKSELQQVVKKRTDYEYTLRRRELSSDNFYSYLQYEINLDKLLSLRCARLVDEGFGGRDNAANLIRMIQAASIKHICYIFDRAIRRFTSEVELWNDYIAFLVSKKANRILGATFGKAVALHPKVESFWLQAASFELEQNQNTHAARALLQRALRYAPASRALWSQYFDLELWSAVRTLERQRILGLESDAAVLGGAPVVVFKHALRHVSDLDFVCSLHEAAVRVMGSVANTLEQMMLQEYGSDSRLQEYLVRVRVQLALDAHTGAAAADVLTSCSRAFAACFESLESLGDSDNTLDAIACGAFYNTLNAVRGFLVAHAQSGPLTSSAPAGSKKRRRESHEPSVDSFMAHLRAVSDRLLALQSRAHAREGQLVVECRCVESRVLVHLLVEALGVDPQPANAIAPILNTHELIDWLRYSGKSLREVRGLKKVPSSSSSSSSSSSQQGLSVWAATASASLELLVQLTQLGLLDEACRQTRLPSAVAISVQGSLETDCVVEFVFLLLEYADLLIQTSTGAAATKRALDLLLSLRGFDSAAEDILKRIVLLKHYPEQHEEGGHVSNRVHFMVELVRLSTASQGDDQPVCAGPEGVRTIAGFQSTVAWLLQQVDQRPSLFFDADLAPFYEYVLEYLLLFLGVVASDGSVVAGGTTQAFAVTVAERAVAKYPGNANLWSAFQGIERVCGRHDKVQHLQWRAKI